MTTAPMSNRAEGLEIAARMVGLRGGGFHIMTYVDPGECLELCDIKVALALLASRDAEIEQLRVALQSLIAAVEEDVSYNHDDYANVGRALPIAHAALKEQA